MPDVSRICPIPACQLSLILMCESPSDLCSCMSIMVAVHALTTCGHTMCGELFTLIVAFLKYFHKRTSAQIGWETIVNRWMRSRVAYGPRMSAFHRIPPFE